jgi:hypothetical protein
MSNMPRLQTLLTSFLLALGLAACGGGGGSTSTPLNVSPGVYSGTVDGGQWLSVLLPDTVTTNWYTLHYPSNNADLYSGKFRSVGTATPSAASGDLVYFPSNARPLHNGSGNMSAPTSTSISTNLEILAANADPGKSVSASLTALTTTARLADLQGAWNGQISYGDGAVVSNKTITFTTSSTAASAAAFDFTSCMISNVTLTPSSDIHVFNVSLQLDAQTGCRFTEAPAATSFTMTGVAVITTSPRTLYFLAIKTSGANKGQGFSFTGTP